jgi:hypothetical protein
MRYLMMTLALAAYASPAAALNPNPCRQGSTPTNRLIPACRYRADTPTRAASPNTS